MDTNYTTARFENLPAYNSTLKYACFDSFPCIRALKENALPIGLCCPRTRGAVKSPVDLTREASSGPYLTVLGPPPTGWGSPLPGAGPARWKHLQEPKFCRPRPPLASHRGPLLAPPSPSSISGSPTRHFRDRGADAALGSPPAARLPGPGARTTGGTAPRNPGFRGWPRRPVKGATDGTQPTGAPRTGRGRAPGSRARHREPGAQPAARVGLPPSPHWRPPSSAPPPLLGSAAPGPCPPAPVWTSSACGAATF